MTEHELDDLLSAPRAETTAALDACPGDIIILGAGGKMGPTLARMAAQACTDSRRVIAELRRKSLTESNCFARNHMHQRAALKTREN